MAMTSEPIRFTDGAGYDRFMGVWSRLVGQDFLDWIAPNHGLRWLDVGCGNGAFTQLIAEQCEPLRLVGIDPSEAQLAYARQQPLLQSVAFVNADAMALPFHNDAFDLAVMPLVIFFVPEPAQGVAEMARVVGTRLHRLRRPLDHRPRGAERRSGRAHAIQGTVPSL
jgi:ubiquinone/menaquinone biosynthesis C-methylase UbiE